MTLPTWTLQDRIRKAREHAGLKQDELAQVLKTTRQTLGRWENGSNTPTEKNLQALAEATGVPLSWFYATDSTAQQDATPPSEILLQWNGDSYQIGKSQ